MTPKHTVHTPEDRSPLAIPVGAVVPYDMALDRELRQFSQDEYGFEQLDLLFTRTPFQPMAVTVEQAREISRPDQIADALRATSATGPAGYIYGCTSGSFVRGLAGERRLAETMAAAGAEAAAAARFAVDTAGAYDSTSPELAAQPFAVTTSGALLEAAQLLGVTRIAAATPYDEAIGALFGRFFAEAGMQLVHTANLGRSGRIWTVPWEVTYDLVRAADHPEAEAVLVACTNLPTYEILDQLEQDLGKPVLSANQTTVWSALRQAGGQYAGPGSALQQTGRRSPETTSVPAPTA
ncbi:maleate cis-trans isomerase family protein [Nesterenkonia alkaliphila]|uniref:maleate cis-trans isomerase family protein n=1 Tax=Nesterenkonia alkaliphila TaxID=1463631 RepID=UPI001663DD30|nr:Asp/Glu racemase [Nesterenkonia alkaliphila]GFZ84815.1 Asp/Glu/hydantoin racemase [Nesterenkonia alkaliphila]